MLDMIEDGMLNVITHMGTLWADSGEAMLMCQGPTRALEQLDGARLPMFRSFFQLTGVVYKPFVFDVHLCHLTRSSDATDEELQFPIVTYTGTRPSLVAQAYTALHARTSAELLIELTTTFASIDLWELESVVFQFHSIIFGIPLRPSHGALTHGVPPGPLQQSCRSPW